MDCFQHALELPGLANPGRVTGYLGDWLQRRVSEGKPWPGGAPPRECWLQAVSVGDCELMVPALLSLAKDLSENETVDVQVDRSLAEREEALWTGPPEYEPTRKYSALSRVALLQLLLERYTASRRPERTNCLESARAAWTLLGQWLEDGEVVSVHDTTHDRDACVQRATELRA
jgi:hypothetical protein